jgi:hypothetical protein
MALCKADGKSHERDIRDPVGVQVEEFGDDIQSDTRYECDQIVQYKDKVEGDGEMDQDDFQIVHTGMCSRSTAVPAGSDLVACEEGEVEADSGDVED